jgi:hypothetical protein
MGRAGYEGLTALRLGAFGIGRWGVPRAIFHHGRTRNDTEKRTGLGEGWLATTKDTNQCGGNWGIS